MPDNQKKTTGFAIDKGLLKRFQRSLDDAGFSMAPVLVAWIEAFMAAPEEKRRDFLHGTIPAKSGIDPVTVPDVLLHTPTGEILISEEEWRWVSRVLRIVRGHVGEAIGPLDTNLDAFVTLTNLVRGINESTGGTISGSVSSLGRALAEIERLQASTGQSLERVEESVERVAGGIPEAERTAQDVIDARKGMQRRGKRNQGGGG